MAEETEAQNTGSGSSGAGVEPVTASLTPGDQVSALWRRLKEHRIAQWAIGYVAIAYGIQHAVVLTTESLDWPHVVTRVSMLLLALGLPFAVTFAWYHGARANHRISGPELTIISILLVGLSLLFYVFIRPSEQIAARPVVAAPATTAVAPAAKPTGISVAVLPFLNLSGDPKEEFFSDGMTEEITSALAKIPNLPVVGRTSAFAYKGKNQDLRVMGEALGATYLLEGSVRKDGNEVRITAQLIKVATGDHLWTDSYDRELKSIFAVQEDVAKSIAAALQVPLGLKEGEALVSNRTSDTQSYEDYLRALALYRARDIKDVIAVLEPMVKRDPTYAPAWALLAQAYNFEPVYMLDMTRPVSELRRERDSAYNLAENSAARAIELDPKYAPGYTALGYARVGDNHWAEADSAFQKALALDPDDPDTLHLYSLSLVEEGRLKQALQMRTTLHKLEPFVPIYNVYTAVVMLLNGDNKGAAALLEPLPPDGAVGAQRNEYLAFAYATQGRYALAADTILKITPNLTYISTSDARLAADIIRKAPVRIEAGAQSLASLNELGFVYFFVGAPERFLDMPERLLEAHLTGARVSWLIFDPSLSAVHKSGRFKALMRNEGLIDYWRAHGWPDFCHPTNGDDFVCN